jgi:hypothetical protein
MYGSFLLQKEKRNSRTKNDEYKRQDPKRDKQRKGDYSENRKNKREKDWD